MAKASRNRSISEAGDFLFVPPGVPHEAINLSTTEPARAIVARNDPAEQDKVAPYQPRASVALPLARPHGGRDGRSPDLGAPYPHHGSE